MNPGIFLIQNNDELVEMNEQAYDSESLLQTLLAKYPSLLAGNQIDPSAPRRWLLIERECGVPSQDGQGGRWAMDHLFLDQDAVPTIVEVKRSSNTEIRRKVVGQMLDYAANAVVYWPASYMRERFAAGCEKDGLDPEEKLSKVFGEGIDSEEFWDKANRNLRDRKIRLLFVADEIPPELQRIVEFLNEQMDTTEVLAIEIKQFMGEGRTGLVPRVIGYTTEAEQRKSGTVRTRIDESVIDELPPEERKVARKILEWSRNKFSRVNWGRASFIPVLDYAPNLSHVPISVYCRGKTSRVEVSFKWMKKKNELSDQTLIRLLERLNTIPGVNLAPDSINRYPSIPLTTLSSSHSLEEFLKAIEWTIEEVKAVQQNARADLLSRSAQS